MSPFRLPLRLLISVLALSLWIHGASSVRGQAIDPASVVGYSPTVQALQGEPGVNFPQSYQLRITAPRNLAATTTVNLVVDGNAPEITFYSAPPVGGELVGAVNLGGIPNPATQITSLTFNPIPADAPAGTAPEYIDVWVSLNLEPGTPAGIRAFQFRADGWAPAATNFGASINATVTYADQKAPPTVTITGLSSGTTVLNPDLPATVNTIVAPLGSVVEVEVAFTAVSTGTEAQQSDVTVSALLNGSSVTDLSLGGTPRAVSASTTLQIVADSTAGTDYTFTAKATNDGGNGEDVTTFRIVGSPILKLTPVIQWATPADIVVGTPLTSLQLNAVAKYNSQVVPGTYEYAPAAGTLLEVGDAQELAVTFTPTDSARFESVSTTVRINVLPVAGNGGCGTAVVRHAPVLNGQAVVEGSLHVLLPESIALNGQVLIAHSLLLPGNPLLRLNGHPFIATQTPGNQVASIPTAAYTLTLNGQPTVGTLRVQTAPDYVWGAVGVPSGSIVDFTSNGKSETVVLSPGNYRNVTINGKNRVKLLPGTYNIRKLTLNGDNTVEIPGATTINLEQTLVTNGTFGGPANATAAARLDVNVSAGGLTLNGKGKFYGFVNAPSGAVTLNGRDLLKGGLAADRLIINGQGVVDLCHHD